MANCNNKYDRKINQSPQNDEQYVSFHSFIPFFAMRRNVIWQVTTVDQLHNRRLAERKIVTKRIFHIICIAWPTWIANLICVPYTNKIEATNYQLNDSLLCWCVIVSWYQNIFITETPERLICSESGRQLLIPAWGKTMRFQVQWTGVWVNALFWKINWFNVHWLLYIDSW